MGVAVPAKRGAVRSDSRNVVRGQETRRRILDCARRRILDESFQALRLDDLAADAGVTKAAVVKSVGGKATILLTLGEEDRQTRLAAIREARAFRTGLERRIADLARRLYELDQPRFNVVMAFIGYLWFWTGDDFVRAQAMVDDTRDNVSELILAASATRPSPERLKVLSHRVLAGYVIGLRDIHHGRASVEEAVRSVVDHVFD
jgi:AcrR family transcriptional regulator